jgi:hypothetical protein
MIGSSSSGRRKDINSGLLQNNPQFAKNCESGFGKQNLETSESEIPSFDKIQKARSEH